MSEQERIAHEYDTTGVASGSTEDLFKFMADRTTEANKTLAPEQKAITYGDHWVQFANFGGDLVAIFGKVYALDYWDTKIAEAVDAEDRQEWEWEKESIIDSHENGYLYGWAWSIIDERGDPGPTHRAMMWPITQDLFETAEAVNWKIEDLPLLAKIELERHYQAYRAHVIKVATGP